MFAGVGVLFFALFCCGGSEVVVRVFEENETLRYVSLVRRSLVGKRLSGRREVLVRFRKCDEWLRCRQEKVLSAPWNVAHNAAAFEVGSKLVFLGGRDDARRKGRDGVYLWPPSRLAFRGDHRGCEERRPQFFGRCEFDGKFSVAAMPMGNDDRYFLLYARANLASNAVRGSFGGRHVQVATFTMAPLFRLSPFRRLRILNYPDDPGRDDNIYFAAVNRNPVVLGERETFLGLFPVTSPTPAIAIAVSKDGHTFASMTVLRPSTLTPDGRTRDHPVDGLIVLPDQRLVLVFIQTDVPGIDLGASNATSAPRSRLLRIDLAFDYLANLTKAALAELRSFNFEKKTEEEES
mmetsp:Transcript_29757/g.95990  ORF Transcript_29757/g.95990 Transcript_29757/m.95990 type:complete len:349 (-) Transcript_29757:443-1489(-)